MQLGSDPRFSPRVACLVSYWVTLSVPTMVGWMLQW